jgi:hypothetical protein
MKAALMPEFIKSDAATQVALLDRVRSLASKHTRFLAKKVDSDLSFRAELMESFTRDVIKASSSGLSRAQAVKAGYVYVYDEVPQ